MSLLRLLSSGKSLVDFRSSESRYRMRVHGLLPKFGSGKNPFLARTLSARPAEPAAPEPVAPAPALPQLGEAEAAIKKQTAPLTATNNAVAPKAEAQPGWFARFFRRTASIGNIIPGMNPFKGRPGAAPRPRPAIPAAPHGPVQTELSLDNIKVVRNDLSDADVEVVSAKSTGKTKTQPVTSSGAHPELAATRPG